jgi:hypothetical protein
VTKTLTLGLPLDHEFPLYERHNRAVNGFDPTGSDSPHRCSNSGLQREAHSGDSGGQFNVATSANNISDPCPAGFIKPTGASLGVPNLSGTGDLLVQRELPQCLLGALSVQQQIDPNTYFQIAYIGAYYVKLPVDQSLNVIPRQYLSTSPTRDTRSSVR